MGDYPFGRDYDLGRSPTFNYLEIPEFVISENFTVEQVVVRMMYLHLVNDHGKSHWDAKEALGLDDETVSRLLELDGGS